MKLVLGIAGDRHYSDFNFFSKVLQDDLERFGATEFVIGDCTGVDTMAYEWALANGMPYTIYCASRYNWRRLNSDGASVILCSDWGRDGKMAGPKRNAMLVHASDRVLLFDGGGKGSRSVAHFARKYERELERWVIDAGGECPRSHEFGPPDLGPIHAN